MKKILPLALTGLLLIGLSTACGSSKANCDAYGYNSSDEVSKNDLAQE